MPLPRDAAPTTGSDRGPGHRDRLVAPDPGRPARSRRSACRPGRTGGGAGGPVPDLGCGTGASTAAPAAAFPD
ncbi:ubiquinone biosynthesis methyltransferase UbiE, partial [Streptomyces sp. NPDC058737]